MSAAAVIAAGVLLWPRPHPCRATFEKVREGMTREEVDTVVGGPPGDYSDGGDGRPIPPASTLTTEEELLADDGRLSVLFS